MTLTDKCKEDFEKWYRLEYRKNTNKYLVYALSAFNGFHTSMKYGVYVDFFDSADILIESSGYFDGEKQFYDWIVRTKQIFNGSAYESRQEARTKAIEKANEIYNK